MHLRGAISSGTGPAFDLPAGLVPKSIDIDVPAVMGDLGSAGYVDITDGFLEPSDGSLPTGTAAFTTFLEGVSFPSG